MFLVKPIIRERKDLLSRPTSLLLKILKELPCVSSLEIDERILLSFLNNPELSEYLNKKINVLYISSYSNKHSMKSDEVDLIFKIFSNVEQVYCQIEKLDDLLSILRQCLKFSMITLVNMTKHTYSWIEMNASKLNVYIDFYSIVEKD